MDLDERCKLYESFEAQRRLIPTLPVLARLDGRNFHTFLKNAHKPYDGRVHRLMVDTAQHLTEESSARCAYTQSDEITLFWLVNDVDTQMFFDGRIQKLTSTLAAMASVFFNRRAEELHKAGESLDDLAWSKIPTFDCRVWNVPSVSEAANNFIWRQQDAKRNSILMLGQSEFSHKQMHGLSCDEVQEKLFQERQINWSDQPDWAKRGTYLVRELVTHKYDEDQRTQLPERHPAKHDPNASYTRRSLVERNFELASMPVSFRCTTILGPGREEALAHASQG